VQVRYSAADITKPAEINTMIEDTAATFGSIDILVTNAGIQHVAPIDDSPVEKWDAIIAIDLSSAFHTTRAALAKMKVSGWGRIISITSAHGLVASPYKSAYVADTHGVMGLTKTIALEVAEQGVTCNAICPGYVQTPLVEGQIADTAKARGISRDEVMRDVLLAAQPTKKFVQPEQLGALIVYLAGDQAAAIIGNALTIDGGWTGQ
jgi:3-hydroxybutyrate dehydrogenase